MKLLEKETKRERFGYPPITHLAGGAAEEMGLPRAPDPCAEEPVAVLLLLCCYNRQSPPSTDS